MYSRTFWYEIQLRTTFIWTLKSWAVSTLNAGVCFFVATNSVLSWGYIWGRGKPSVHHAAPRTEELFQFLRGVACSGRMGNSPGLPHFDLPTCDGSDCGSLWGLRLGSVPRLHYPSRGCSAAPRLASASNVFLALLFTLARRLNLQPFSRWCEWGLTCFLQLFISNSSL